jgi:hypothetical protein
MRLVRPRTFARITSAWGANSQRTWRQAPHGGVSVFASVTMMTVVNSRAPSESALKIAVRSAHCVREKLAFSMLQPV